MTKKKSTTSSFFDSAINFAQEKISESIDRYVQKHITDKLVKAGEVSLLFLLGVIFVIVGTAQFLASLLAYLENGLNYIVIGVVFLFIAYFISVRE